MGSPYVNQAAIFLIETLFGLYLLAFMLRFLLQWVRANFYNPFVQFIVQVTNPPLRPVRRVIPGLWGLDVAAVVIMMGLLMIKWLLLLWIMDHGVEIAGLLVVAVADLLRLLINVFFWAVIMQAILTWVHPDPRHPMVSLLYQLTAPILRPARHLIPPMSGIDLSPLLVLIGLQLLLILVIAPLQDIGLGLLKLSPRGFF